MGEKLISEWKLVPIWCQNCFVGKLRGLVKEGWLYLPIFLALQGPWDMQKLSLAGYCLKRPGKLYLGFASELRLRDSPFSGWKHVVLEICRKEALNNQPGQLDRSILISSCSELILVAYNLYLYQLNYLDHLRELQQESTKSRQYQKQVLELYFKCQPI